MASRLVLLCSLLVATSAEFAVFFTGEANPDLDRGIGFCSFSTTVLSCDILHNVEEAASISLHTGLVGRTGSVITSIATSGSQLDVTSPLGVSFNISQVHELDLLRGRLFLKINAATADSARGHVGIYSEYAFTADGDVSQLVPPGSGPHASRTVCSGTEASMRCMIFHNSVSANSIRIVAGSPSENGAEVKVACSSAGECINPVSAVIDMAADRPNYNDLRTDNAYVIIEDGGGLSRGAFVRETPTAMPIPPVRFTHFTTMNAQQELAVSTSPAIGIGLFHFNPSTRVLQFHVEHNVEDVIGVHLHKAPIGRDAQPGDLKIFLGEDTSIDVLSPLVGRVTLTEEGADALRSLGLYINIHSVEFPSGAIRGQLYENLNAQSRTFVSELTGGGAGLSTPVGTSASGAVVVSEGLAIPSNVMYHIAHNAHDPSEVLLHLPTTGRTVSWDSTDYDLTMPLQGELSLTIEEFGDVISSRAVVTVRTTTYPDGQLSGQLHTVASVPTANYVSKLTGSKRFISTAETFDIGVAICEYDRANRELFVTVAHNVSGATGAALYIGASGKLGEPLAVLVSTPDQAQSPFSTSLLLTADQELALTAGLVYLEITSTEFPIGAVRGQLGVFDGNTFAGIGNGDAAVPPNPDFDGYSISLYEYDPATNMLTYTIFHDVTNANPIHIHHGTVLDNGVHKYFVCDSDASCSPENHYPIVGSYFLDGSLPNLTSFETGEAYLNIHLGGPGVVRGQVAKETPFPAVTTPRVISHHAVMDATQVSSSSTSTARGLALFSYDSQAQTLYYHIQHNVPDATVVHLHVAPAGQTAAPGALRIVLGSSQTNGGYFTPTATESPLFGTIDVNEYGSTLVNPLRSGRLYVNIADGANPDGAIRGQVYEAATEGSTSRVAEFSGGQELVPVGTAFHAVAHVAITGATTADALILHDVFPNPTGLHLHFPTPANRIDLGVVSPSLNAAVTLTEVQMADLVSGLAYINIHTTQYPAGELWGQLLPLGELQPYTPPPGALETEVESGGLSGGALAAVIISSIVGACCVAACIFAIIFKVLNRSPKQSKPKAAAPKTTATGTTEAARSPPTPSKDVELGEPSPAPPPKTEEAGSAAPPPKAEEGTGL